MMGGGPQQWFC